MKKIAIKIGVFAAVMLSLVSCLKDREVVTYPQCAITSFTIGNITTKFYTKTTDGLNDSTYTRVIDGTSIAFNIDQLKGEIESVDSIIGWADISRVVPTITYSGLLFCKQRGWDDYYSFTSGSDSVDFTQDVEFLVISSDQENSRVYKAKLNKANLLVDSLYWTDRSTTGLTLNGKHRSVVIGKNIYTFADNGGVPTVTWFDTEADAAWTTPETLTGSAATLDIASIVVFQDKFYGLDTDGHLYCSTTETQGSVWMAVGSETFSQLLCADKTYLYAFDGSQIVQSSDLMTWTANGNTDLDKLPAAPIQSAAYDSQTNASMQHVVMVGTAGTTEKASVTWYKISSADTDSNQPWNYIPAPTGSDYILPAMENLTMVRLGNQLLAFGGADANVGDTKMAYKTLYSSVDQGLSWQPFTTKKSLPKELHENLSLEVSAVVVGSQIWLMQSGGKVWCGEIGHQL